MFSRSDKNEEVADVMADTTDGPRSPLVMAGIAGLLAIAGAFLLFSYLGSGSDEVAEDAAPTEASENKQVLVVAQTIPAGTSVQELIETPTVYLSARSVPEQFITATAIRDVSELSDIADLTLASDALPGEQLLRAKFIDRSDFNNAPSINDRATVKAPDGHHAVVLTLGSSAALGGLLRAGDQVAVVANCRVGGNDDVDTFEISLVALNAVEVINIDGTLEVAGVASNDATQVGVATRGSFTIALAVEPDELTDLTFAQNYCDIQLATALQGVSNDDFPRAATAMNQIVGADGVWLAEPEDGNVIDLASLFAFRAEAGESIEVELPEPEDDDEAAEAIGSAAESDGGAEGEDGDAAVISDGAADLGASEDDEETTPGDS